MLKSLSVYVVKNGYELLVEKKAEKVEGDEKWLDFAEEKFVFEKAAKLKKAIKLFLDEVN